VEAVMIITLFTLIWVGVFFLGEAYNLALTAKSQARGCAFITASESCDRIPEFCVVSVDDGPQNQDESATQDALTSTSQRGKNSTDNAAAQDEQGTDSEAVPAKSGRATKGAMSTMDSEIKNGLFRRAKSSVSVSHESPKLLGGDTVQLDQAFSLPCNPKPGSLADKIMDLLMQTFG
jgi:hypothetical protein